MHRSHHKWFSPALGREMELLVFGHAGAPAIVYPSSMGSFFEYEDRGMVGALAHRLEMGWTQLVCVDSVDKESFYNKRIHPHDRVWRNMQYESYVIHEVVPFIRHINGTRDRLITTGCSFGGYHALNTALRHPDVFNECISMSGAFDIHSFLDGYWDTECYLNCPVDYIAQLTDSWFLERYRQNKYMLAAGDWDICLKDNHRMVDILGSKGIPNWLDVWGGGRVHDWPLWQDMARRYFV